MSLFGKSELDNQGKSRIPEKGKKMESSDFREGFEFQAARDHPPHALLIKLTCSGLEFALYVLGPAALLPAMWPNDDI